MGQNTGALLNSDFSCHPHFEIFFIELLKSVNIFLWIEIKFTADFEIP